MHERKSGFPAEKRISCGPTYSPEIFWPLVYFLFRALDQATNSRKTRLDVYMESADLEDDEGNFGDAGLESKEMWEFVVSVLNKISDKMDAESGFPSRVAHLQMHRPKFTEPTEDEVAAGAT